MGLSCRPTGTMKGMFQRIENAQEKEAKALRQSEKKTKKKG